MRERRGDDRAEAVKTEEGATRRGTQAAQRLERPGQASLAWSRGRSAALQHRFQPLPLTAGFRPPGLQDNKVVLL